MTCQLVPNFVYQKYLDHRVEARRSPMICPNVSYRQIICFRVSHLQYVSQKHIVFHGSWTSSLILKNNLTRFYLFIRLFTSNFYTSSINMKCHQINEHPIIFALCPSLWPPSWLLQQIQKTHSWLDSQRWNLNKKGEQLEEVQKQLIAHWTSMDNYHVKSLATAKCGPPTVLLSMLANVKHQSPKETQNVSHRLQVFLPQIHLRQLNRNPKKWIWI